MAVKHSQSAARVLGVLEKLAEHQPAGTSELARLLDADKSGVQRALMTLVREGWIRAAPGKPRRWELTARIHTLANAAQSGHDLRHRARSELRSLRDQTGETVALNVVERSRFVVADVAESRRTLRVVLTVGATVPVAHSATGRAILAYMSRPQQIEFLGEEPDSVQLEAFDETVTRGYAISSGIVVPGFTNIAAPIFDADSRPVGALLVTGPSDRLPPEDYEKVGTWVASAARKLSRGPAPKLDELENKDEPKADCGVT